MALSTPLQPGSNKVFLNACMDERNAIMRAIAKEESLPMASKAAFKREQIDHSR